jgi:hypothetical protein
MFFHKQRILPLYIIVSIVIAMLVSSSFAVENNPEILRQFNIAVASLPQSNSRKTIDRNLKKIRNILGITETQTNNKNIQDIIPGALKKFSNEAANEQEEIQSLLREWNRYLNTVKNFASTEYGIAIEYQQKEYYSSLNRLANGIQKLNANRKKHSSQWLSELTDRFGKEFARENKEAILANFLVVMNTDYRSYEQEVKDLIYIETMLHGSYKEYFGMFLEFYKGELSQEEQKLLSSRREIAEAILSVIDEIRISKLFETKALHGRMAIHKAQRQNKELYEFFQEILKSHSINVRKAADDLEEM